MSRIVAVLSNGRKEKNWSKHLIPKQVGSSTHLKATSLNSDPIQKRERERERERERGEKLVACLWLLGLNQVFTCFAYIQTGVTTYLCALQMLDFPSSVLGLITVNTF